MSVIRSNYDSRGGDFNFGEMVHDLNIEEQVYLEQIRNFAMQLMRERKMIDVHDKKRRDSFSTEMGMAFSAKHEVDDFGKTATTVSKGGEDEEEESQHKSALQSVLELERGIKAQESDFVNQVSSIIMKEFNLTGTALPHREPVESLYLIKKRQKKKGAMVDEMPLHIEEYMRNMKN